jgi:ATP-dependent DNA ligase
MAEQILANPSNYQQYTFTPKMDGEWNKLIWDGERMYMLSRTLNVQGEYTDRALKVPHIVDEFAATLPKDTVLLGELAFIDVTKSSKDVGSIMRSLVPRALKLQEDERNKLHFYVFDCLMWAGEDISQRPYEQRFVNNAALKQ